MKYTPLLLTPCFIFLLMHTIGWAVESDKSRASQPGTLPEPELAVLDKWRGTWDVTATRRQPRPVQQVTYSETYEWILDGRFLRSETSRKPDGGKGMSMFWFDKLTKNYRLMLFDTSGFGVELPPPAWNESTQTLEWKGGLLSPVSFSGYTTFTDRDSVRFKSLLKDWKGTVLLELEGTSVRRK